MKKLRFQPTFASLTEAELEQLAADVQRETYDAVRKRVCKPRSEGGFDIHFTSDSPLVRLHNKKNRLDLINAQITSGQKLTLAQLDTFTAGEKRAPEEVHDAIMSATYILVTEHDNTPHQLLALQRLADFPARAELREQSAQIRAERMDLARSKEKRAHEMHTHKIALDLRKQDHKENCDAATADQNGYPHSSKSETRNQKSEISVDNSARPKMKILVDEDGETFVRRPGPCPLPDDVVIKNHAYAKKLLAGLVDPVTGEELPAASTPTPNGPLNTDPVITDHSPSSALAQNSGLTTQNFLSPEVIANTNLYDQKIDAGEIRVIYAPGKHYEIEYCNRADQPALERLHKSAPLRFFEDPTRTKWLPGLRTFGKNPYIPPTVLSLNTDSPITDSPITEHSPSSSSAPKSDIKNEKSEIKASSASTPSQTLEERVDHYNNLRAQEYLAFDQQRSRLSKYDPYPNYVTQYRYCPCGNACPCPIHEDEEKFGQYFTFFWSLSPFHSVYANTLRARGLPYNKPKEDLP